MVLSGNDVITALYVTALDSYSEESAALTSDVENVSTNEQPVAFSLHTDEDT